MIFALIVYASVTLINMRAQINNALIKQEELAHQVAEKEASNQSLQNKIDHKGDKDFIADAARDDFGYVAPGEKVFVKDAGN